MNESSHSWRVCVHVVFLWAHVPYEILWPCGLAVNEPQSWTLCHTTCHLWSLQHNFKYHLHLLNHVWGGALHMIFEVVLKDIIAGIHVQWAWWPWSPAHEVLWKSLNLTGHGYQTCRISKMTFTICGCAPLCWKDMPTCPAPWMTRMTSFCSCYRFYWFVMVPSAKICPVYPCSLIAHHTVPFSE